MNPTLLVAILVILVLVVIGAAIWSWHEYHRNGDNDV